MSRTSDTFISTIRPSASTSNSASSSSFSSPATALSSSSSSSSSGVSATPLRVYHDPPPSFNGFTPTLLSPCRHPTPTTTTADPRPTGLPIVNLVVVGLVTDTTARFLLELNGDREVVVKLVLVQQNARSILGVPTRADNGEVQEKYGLREQKVKCVANRVSVVRFSDLLPNAKYQIQLVGCIWKTSGSILTDLTERNPATCPMNITAVSCNMIGQSKLLKKEDIDLWKEMAERIRNDTWRPDLLFHIGDQVYADEPRDNRLNKDAPYQLVWDVATEWLKVDDDQNPNSWEKHREHVTELYRELYRETWGWEGTDYVLANTSNLMIFDDHDFRDEWGQSEADADPKSMNGFIGSCARRAQFEYQRQLYTDVDFDRMDEVKSDHHAHVFGKTIGILMGDVRGPSAQYKVPDDPTPYLGSHQWSNIHRWLSKDGIFSECKQLIACFGTPLVYLPPTLNDLSGHTVIRDSLGHWANERYRHEQIQMLEILNQWKRERPNREVLLLAGDVHVGGFTAIYKANHPPMLQFITSAICNYLLKNIEFALGQASQFVMSNLGENWKFKHRKFVRERNYGEIQITADAAGGLIRCRHIQAQKGHLQGDWVDTRAGLGKESEWMVDKLGKDADEIAKEQKAKYEHMKGKDAAFGQTEKVVALKTIENPKSEDGRIEFPSSSLERGT